MNGKDVMQPPGHDTLSIIDMSKPADLRIVATIPIDNTIAGPPTNLAITPNRDLALVANSLKAVKKTESGEPSSDDRLFVVDLKANPPAIIATLHLGKRPSGMAINAAGTMALVATATTARSRCCRSTARRSRSPIPSRSGTRTTLSPPRRSPRTVRPPSPSNQRSTRSRC